jgi:release factor glutamine methyltransferase
VTARLDAQIAAARERLVRAGLSAADAALDAEVLARHVLGWDRARLIVFARQPPPETFAAAYDAVISRRIRREPVALITGHREFWGLDFEVTEDVLVPRPETELIVEQALERLPSGSRGPIVDVGTGSGCIAVALAHERPSLHVIAIDLSAEALGVAARNSVRHNTAGRVHLVRGDLLEPVRGPVDLIVSNPPYVAPADAAGLQREVVEHEPHTALFAAEDGLAVLRRLCESAASRLAARGSLIVEFGAGQEERLSAIAHASGWTIETVPDLAGIPRVAVMARERFQLPASSSQLPAANSRLSRRSFSEGGRADG